MLVKIERESLAGESIKSKLPVLGKFPRIWEKMNLTVSMTRTIIDPTMNHDRERSIFSLNKKKSCPKIDVIRVPPRSIFAWNIRLSLKYYWSTVWNKPKLQSQSWESWRENGLSVHLEKSCLVFSRVIISLLLPGMLKVKVTLELPSWWSIAKCAWILKLHLKVNPSPRLSDANLA